MTSNKGPKETIEYPSLDDPQKPLDVTQEVQIPQIEIPSADELITAAAQDIESPTLEMPAFNLNDSQDQFPHQTTEATSQQRDERFAVQQLQAKNYRFLQNTAQELSIPPGQGIAILFNNHAEERVAIIFTNPETQEEAKRVTVQHIRRDIFRVEVTNKEGITETHDVRFNQHINELFGPTYTQGEHNVQFQFGFESPYQFAQAPRAVFQISPKCQYDVTFQQIEAISLDEELHPWQDPITGYAQDTLFAPAPTEKNEKSQAAPPKLTQQQIDSNATQELQKEGYIPLGSIFMSEAYVEEELKILMLNHIFKSVTEVLLVILGADGKTINNVFISSHPKGEFSISTTLPDGTNFNETIESLNETTTQIPFLGITINTAYNYPKMPLAKAPRITIVRTNKPLQKAIAAKGVLGESK